MTDRQKAFKLLEGEIKKASIHIRQAQRRGDSTAIANLQERLSALHWIRNTINFFT